MRESLQESLTEDRIRADLSAQLREVDGHLAIDGKELTLPEDVRLDLVARSFHTYEYDIGFGDHYRALVAIGGVTSVEHGVPIAGLCFATLWYTSSHNLLTVDFTAQMP